MSKVELGSVLPMGVITVEIKDMFDRSPRSIFFSHIKGNTEKNY
jgi:hypothetical protein